MFYISLSRLWSLRLVKLQGFSPSFSLQVQGRKAVFILKISQNCKTSVRWNKGKASTRFVNPPGYVELFFHDARLRIWRKSLPPVLVWRDWKIWSSWRWEFSMVWKERFAEFEAASYHMNHILFPTQIVVIITGMGWMLQEQGGAMLPLKGTCMVSQSNLNSQYDSQSSSNHSTHYQHFMLRLDHFFPRFLDQGMKVAITSGEFVASSGWTNQVSGADLTPNLDLMHPKTSVATPFLKKILSPSKMTFSRRTWFFSLYPGPSGNKSQQSKRGNQPSTQANLAQTMAQWVVSSQALRLENAERPGLVDYEEIFEGFFRCAERAWNSRVVPVVRNRVFYNSWMKLSVDFAFE